MVPILILGVIMVFAICLFMSHLLTKRIVTPIEKMTSEMKKYEEFHENVPYEELKPFASTIWEQHENISQQLKALEKSDRIRQEFTANVSHELKTPLTSISGYAELIESGMTKAEDLSRFGGEIRKNATRLLHLINDILKLSELDEVDIEVTKENIDLYEIARKCMDALALSAKKHQVELTLQGTKAIVYANKDMMEELINNLCDNAIRYNRPQGKVIVRISPRNEYTELVVQDTGIGIPKEYLERIFERFYRVDKSRSKETGGTGLGLAIVKHVVAKHGDRLQIESEVGVGTIISVEL
jgi:two-component system phosphate regulon sensor histidine kinase PhoR